MQEERFNVPEDSYNPILFFLENEGNPETIARFGVTRKALDRMSKDWNLQKNGSGVYFLKKEKIRYKVSPDRKGYCVEWIKMPGKRLNFPGTDASVKGRRIIIDY